MQSKKSNINNRNTREPRRKRAERELQSADQIATRSIAKIIMTRESRTQESCEQRDEHLRRVISR